MDKADVIRISMEVGLINESGDSYISIEDMQRFANLVAAAERKACAKVCEEPIDLVQITDDCSEYVYKNHLDCAEDIRARGQ
jgi:hypothetical protein